MSTKRFFREMALEAAPKQSREIDALTEESPILSMVPMQPTSNGLQNVFEELQDVEGAKVVNLDSELPLIDANGKINYEDLAVLGGIIQVGMDKARKMGGAVAYFMKKIPSIFRVTSQNIEYSLLYNTILAYSKENKQQTLAGGSANANYSMCVVKWVEGETTGLYDPEGFGRGDVFDVIPLSSGDLHTITTEDGKKIPGYATLIKSYIGFQFANKKHVASIRNIDLTPAATETGFTALPTEVDIDNMLLRARATPANSFIYCHPAVLSALNVYKGGALNMSPSDQNFDRTVEAWNGIRFITSYNFEQGTEANATNLA